MRQAALLLLAFGGTFALQLAIPASVSPEGLRVTASTASGEGTAWLIRQ